MSTRVTLLGAGHIAQALARGWQRDAVPPALRPLLTCHDPMVERRDALCRTYAAAPADHVGSAVVASEVVVLAMRPDDVPAALAAVAPHLGDRALVSVAAFVGLDALEAGLHPGARVGRVMPNVAAAVGRAALPMVAGSLRESAELVALTFGLLGTVVAVDEALYDAATALAGCGPGFAAYLLEAMTERGVALGLGAEASRELAAAAMDGAAALVAAGDDPGTLWRGVAVPGGMTAAGIESLQRAGVAGALADAVSAAVDRARGR